MKLAVTSAVWRVAMCGAVAGIFATTVPQLGFAQGDPMIGTWKVNLAKFTYSPGPLREA